MNRRHHRTTVADIEHKHNIDQNDIHSYATIHNPVVRCMFLLSFLSNDGATVSHVFVTRRTGQ